MNIDFESHVQVYAAIAACMVILLPKDLTQQHSRMNIHSIGEKVMTAIRWKLPLTGENSKVQFCSVACLQWRTCIFM